MTNDKVFQMSFAKVYSLLENKAVKKGRTVEEVRTIIEWLTGYGGADIENMLIGSVTYGDFFKNALMLNPNRKLIKGVVCGVRVETIEEPLMREIRYLDKGLSQV